MNTNNKIEELKEMINSMERTLFAVRGLLSELAGEKTLISKDNFLHRNQSKVKNFESKEKIVEGVFDGVGMQDKDEKTYPVPSNYASKSKIVVGDKMKLTITNEGQFVYKQIGPAMRKNLKGPLVCENGIYKVLSEGKEYNILTASITFHKASIGDELSILVPEGVDVEWGALDYVIPKE
jgi:hypothetical protein